MTKEEVTILLADDHPIILQGTKTLLEESGYHVGMLASNGADAYASIERDHPMIAILDVNMPRMSGIEVARLVDQKKLNTKIILLTMHITSIQKRWNAMFMDTCLKTFQTKKYLNASTNYSKESATILQKLNMRFR
jgi:DNA-binding NarL/FixJ family response regulator